jgi:hypothetical protein
MVGVNIAETVVFLAFPAAAGITGQVIAVTGWACNAQSQGWAHRTDH